MDGLVWGFRYTDEVNIVRQNLCKAPDFAYTPTAYWTTSGATGTNAQGSSSNAKFGQASLTRSVTSTAAALVVWDPTLATLDVTAGTQYTCYAYVKSSTSRTARVNLDWRNSGGASISTSNGATVTTSTSTYVQPYVTATAPAGAVTVRIQLEITNAVNGDSHYWSAVMLEATGTLKTWFCGTDFETPTPPTYVSEVYWDGLTSRSTSTQIANTWYTGSNIQQADYTKGRRRLVDDYPVDQASVEVGPIPSWSPPPKVGNRFVLYVLKSGVQYAAFYGRIRDVRNQYGIVQNADRCFIEVDGVQAEWGRAQLNSVSISSANTESQVDSVSAAAGIPIASFFGRSTGAALTWTGNAFDALNLITRTEEARMFQYGPASTASGTGGLWWYGRDLIDQTTYWLSDGTYAHSGSTYDIKFDNLTFLSAAEEFYNFVTIESQPGTVANQTTSSGTDPQFALVRQTNDVSVSQALSHSQYLYNQFSVTTATIREISFLDVTQSGAYPNDFYVLALATGERPVKIAVGFRTARYDAILEGTQVSAVPGQTRVRLFLSAADNNPYLILDDADYGKLNSNRLGF